MASSNRRSPYLSALCLRMPPNLMESTSKMSHHVIRAAVRKATHEKLLKRQHQAKVFQLDASTRITAGKDTILIAPMGSGKTLVLAMPLLYHTNKTSIVISPLQALETDQVDQMNELGMESILIDTVDLPADLCISTDSREVAQASRLSSISPNK
jgi:ATP-dependent helicase YprA (DUF1998 family)